MLCSELCCVYETQGKQEQESPRVGQEAPPQGGARLLLNRGSIAVLEKSAVGQGCDLKA